MKPLALNLSVTPTRPTKRHPSPRMPLGRAARIAVSLTLTATVASHMVGAVPAQAAPPW